MSQVLSLSGVKKSFKSTGKKVARYRLPLFLLLLVAIYGFIIFRINTLVGIAPDQSAVSLTTKTTRAHIDEAVAKKIQDLQDNSVNVQSLFREARQNPFQE